MLDERGVDHHALRVVRPTLLPRQSLLRRFVELSITGEAQQIVGPSVASSVLIPRCVVRRHCLESSTRVCFIRCWRPSRALRCSLLPSFARERARSIAGVQLLAMHGRASENLRGRGVSKPTQNRFKSDPRPTWERPQTDPGGAQLAPVFILSQRSTLTVELKRHP